MPQAKVSDVHVTDFAVLPAPEYLCREIRRTDDQASFVAKSRKEINQILFGNDPRILLVVGPCSIHDVEAGKEYAAKLAKLAEEVSDRFLVVMRVYFEKPRTTVGWKGLIMDPYLDGTYNIPQGLKIARRFLQEVLDMGLATATELLDPITPQYIADLISWSAIGARTTESQIHRQMASGLSMPLGFKNGTSGNTGAAINAIKAAGQKQTFMGISFQGLASAVTTRGNPDCHIILRGGTEGPNYSSQHVKETKEALEAANLSASIMVDCSHANCSKDVQKMPEVLADVIEQCKDRSSGIIGLMLESNLMEGSQKFPQPKEDLQYGLSITDPCLNWDTTEKVIRDAYNALAPRFQ